MAIVVAEQNDQFQIGDEVIYMPEQVITRVTGYDWLQCVDVPAKILAYQLACGISAAKDLLRPFISDRPYATGGLVHFFEQPTPEQRKKASAAINAAMRAGKGR